MIKGYISILIIFAMFGCISLFEEPAKGSISCVGESCSNNTTLLNQQILFANNTSSEEYLSIPLSELSTNIKKYTYVYDGVEIRYFAVLGSDGNTRTAFDACKACFYEKKGYYQEGSDVVCGNCGLHFEIDSLGKDNLGGGCWPVHLESKVQGEHLLINKHALENGKYLFE
ncbi:MAG: DUF2318 domain-containing protein [Candidatus ainarchaeum sp.]|nr:DUF2318 domain-containing protein [Candidatus ainarchaeum sp.]